MTGLSLDNMQSNRIRCKCLGRFQVVRWYLSAFHAGRRSEVAKKPYNPIIGETFHCSWKVPKKPEASGEPAQGGPDPAAPQDPYQVRFVAEQVSHHLPVSGFYAECQERRMCVNTHVWTKSKFMGMSIGVSMIGEGEAPSVTASINVTLHCVHPHPTFKINWID